MKEQIMTPKEKANELGNKFYQGSVFDYSKQRHLEEIRRAKERALVCVDEIIGGSRLFYIEDYEYWEEVKQEIKKL